VTRRHPHAHGNPVVRGRNAWLAACASLIALIFTVVAWELALKSWMVLKVLPLLAPLFGVLHGRSYTLRWSTLLIWLYAAEGAARVYTDRGMSAGFAAAEFALALAYFAAAVAYLRKSSSPAPATPP
jgi:uncharacterized membrane protein